MYTLLEQTAVRDQMLLRTGSEIFPTSITSTVTLSIGVTYGVQCVGENAPAILYQLTNSFFLYFVEEGLCFNLFCNMWVCVCVGFAICGYVYVWGLQYVGMCMCGVCNMWVCVCVGCAICGCVYVWGL